MKQWGSLGTGNGQFNDPYNLAVNNTDYVYVADTYNGRIQVFTPNGDYITQWNTSAYKGSRLALMVLR